jgi:hypothetical protein
MSDDEMPPDDRSEDYWFKKMVVDKLRDLAETQKSMAESQREMHDANQEKVDEVVAAVNTIKLEVHSFQLVKQVVFAGIGAALLAMLAAILALVLKTGKVW